MPRRDPRSRARSAPDTSCPCGLPATYGDCCGRLHRGEASATTAEALMRSRFSAFGVGDAGYLLRTWHPSTRPPVVELDDSVRWTRLEVLETTGGSSFHTEGAVRFRAHYVERGEAGHMEEHSRFARHAGDWAYVGTL
ncbi:YchJ family metal-binding protein [Streptosporangium sp. NPDC023963]|uniref:YchJ family protein n=1 Tax=Streptosporangium sp. NPDC023963 TaxID=3155608 RepID=UPI00343A65CC